MASKFYDIVNQAAANDNLHELQLWRRSPWLEPSDDPAVRVFHHHVERLYQKVKGRLDTHARARRENFAHDVRARLEEKGALHVSVNRISVDGYETTRMREFESVDDFFAWLHRERECLRFRWSFTDPETFEPSQLDRALRNPTSVRI